MARQPRTRSSVRIFSVLATLGAAGHNWFERWAGVGVFLEPWLGRRVTDILWAVTPLWLWRCARPRGRGDEAALALNAGISVAGVIVHFLNWPWSRRLGILPWLDEADGLRPSLMPAYNAVLWGWGIGGAGSILFETRRANLKYVAAGLITWPLLLASARHHFKWARDRALEDTGRRWSSAFSGGDTEGSRPSRRDSVARAQN